MRTFDQLLLATLRDCGPCTPEELIAFFPKSMTALDDALGWLGSQNMIEWHGAVWRLTVDGLRETLEREPAEWVI